MKRLLSRMAAIAAAMILTGQVSAQDMRENVTVQYDRIPELRDYEKLNINPRIELSAVRLSALPYSTRQVKVAVPGTITTLAPASLLYQSQSPRDLRS